MLLVGSQALEYYFPGKLDREPDDYDFLATGKLLNYQVEEFNYKEKKRTSHKSIGDISGTTIEFELADAIPYTTSKEIWDYCFSIEDKLKVTGSIIGMVYVAPLEIQKVLKISCDGLLGKDKHRRDLELLKNVTLTPALEELAQKRREETKNRLEIKKNIFFNKYKIPRYFDHDQLHRWLAKDKNPVYTDILEDSVDISKELFDKLDENKKVEMVRDEALVLALERTFIPGVKRAPFLVTKLLDDFLEVRTSKNLALKWLDRLTLNGKLKDHPDWLAIWVTNNYNKIRDGYNIWWKKRVENLPIEFWKRLVFGE